MKKIFLIAILIIVPSHPLRAKTEQSSPITLKVPPYTQLLSKDIQITGNPEKGLFQLKASSNWNFPFEIVAIGPVGGKVVITIHSLEQLKSLNLKNAIILNPEPDPKTLRSLPALCPRLTIKNNQNPQKQNKDLTFIYDANADHFNRIPMFQLFDPDAAEGQQALAYAKMDGKNVLLVKQIKIQHDYEDAKIIKYETKDPQTGKTKTLMEGQGGFYANLHYAVVPYSEKIAKLDKQTLLHLAQGSLKKIGKANLRPQLRTHSLLPGPFLSKTNSMYEMCEWGDTAHQAPEQVLQYQDLPIWDWDYPVQNSEQVLLIVWEGDEEQNYSQRELLPPAYLIDDLVAVFKIDKKDTLKPLTLKNKSKDFEIIVQTGQLQKPYAPPPTKNRTSKK